MNEYKYLVVVQTDPMKTLGLTNDFSSSQDVLFLLHKSFSTFVTGLL